MNKHHDKGIKRRKMVNRKRQALTRLGWILLLLMVSCLFRLYNFSETQAVRTAERQKGWPSMLLVWEQEEENTWWSKSKVQLYVYEDACVFAEMTWKLLDGWNCHFMSVVEPKENQPVRSAEIWFHGQQMMYVVGKITDDSVDVEDITYHIWWSQGDEKEEFTISQEECIYDSGSRYFVHKMDYSHRTTEEEQQCWGLFIRVRDKNGQPILWEDGYADDFGDWMRVLIGYFTSG